MKGRIRQAADWRKYLPHIHISNGKLVFSVSDRGSVFSVFWKLKYNSRKKTVKNQMIQLENEAKVTNRHFPKEDT